MLPSDPIGGAGRLGVVIPTYCEEENIGGLLEKLTRLPLPARILVVDDSSPDRTATVVRDWHARDERVRLLLRRSDPGYGRALRDGMRALLAAGMTAVATMDADHSHDPVHLSTMLAGLAGAD